MENGHRVSNGITNGHAIKKKKENGHVITNGANGTNGNCPESSHHFLTQLFDTMVSEGIDKANDRKNKIVEFKHPKELEQILDLDLKDATSDDRLLSICSDVIKYSVKTGTQDLLKITLKRQLSLFEFNFVSFFSEKQLQKNVCRFCPFSFLACCLSFFNLRLLISLWYLKIFLNNMQ